MKSGFTLTGNFRYFTGLRSANTGNKVSSGSDLPAVVLLDRFSETENKQMNKRRERERETGKGSGCLQAEL